ncbi:MAG: guanylate kinase [Myxococcota bacterium]
MSASEGPRGIPFVVAAPSGTGKTTVCREVLRRDKNVRFSISHTTRPQRKGERDGVDYHFVTAREFRGGVDAGEFLEHAEYAGRLYGTSAQALSVPLEAGHDVLVEIEVQGARQLYERLEDARFIFLLPPTMAVLEERLKGRGTDAPDVIDKRLAVADQELAAVEIFDYVVVNEVVADSAEAVLEIIRAERIGRGAELLERYGREAAWSRWRERQSADC